ncbi:MAG: HDOD domain-containing protein, partial [Comamonas sp.]|nr:HDOD domain-containing protein [Comamonas sp.]
FRLQQPQPSRDAVLRLMKAIDKEQSLDVMEEILGSDPILAYRFLLYTNSAALGLRRGVDSLRRGLVMLGLGTLQRWLADQLPHACTEQDLVPLRTQIVLRARLAERLIEAGVSLELQREMYLCSVFSQLDLLLNEPVANILRRTPLNERIFDGIVGRTGPYAAVLQMSQALESSDAAPIRHLREQEDWSAEDLNRLLLRMLSELKLGMPPSLS